MDGTLALSGPRHAGCPAEPSMLIILRQRARRSAPGPYPIAISAVSRFRRFLIRHRCR
jgi:hypothetical protein